MELRPQDVLVALKLAVMPENVRPTYAGLASDLGMSASEVHAAVKRAKAARLILNFGENLRPNRIALLEFSVHGLKYSFPPQFGPIALGIPTAYAAPPLSGEICPDKDPPPAWPFSKGSIRGMTLLPFTRYAPAASQKDPMLYELLALIDAIRMGRVRERELAATHLERRLLASK